MRMAHGGIIRMMGKAGGDMLVRLIWFIPHLILELTCAFILDYYTLTVGEHSLGGCIKYIKKRYVHLKDWIKGEDDKKNPLE